MPIFDLFSKRQARRRGEVPDVFQYDTIPSAFRVQVVHILRDALGSIDRYGAGETTEAFRSIHNILAREYGVFQLHANSRNVQDAVFNFLLEEEDHEKVIDVIEIAFRAVDRVAREPMFSYAVRPEMQPHEAIDELNQRFLEHGIGYQFENGEVFRVDDEYIHAEATKPALRILADTRYSGANEEFRSAHNHYRHQRYKECLVDCNKAIESTLKAICDEQGWPYDASDTVAKLLGICFENGLIPKYLRSHFSALRSSIESGVPASRNRLAGHGQGRTPKEVPQYLARYILGLTATTIVLLGDAEREV